MNDRELEALLRARFDELRDPGCTHALDVVAWLAGDLTGPEADRVARHVAGCDECQQARRDFEEAQPRRPRWRRKHALLAAAAIAAMALVIPSFLPQPLPYTGSDLTEKGQTAGGDDFWVAVDRGGERWRVVPGEHLESGDRIGLFYGSDHGGHLLVFHTDEHGDVTRLHPTADNPSQIAPAERARLGSGGVLTHGQGCQWFVATFWDREPADGDARTLLNLARRDPMTCTLTVDLRGARSVLTVPVRR